LATKQIVNIGKKDMRQKVFNNNFDFSQILASCQKIVIKIGSSSIVRQQEDGGFKIANDWLVSLAEDVDGLLKMGKQVIIVSSGAIATAKLEYSFDKDYSIVQKQALSSVGQYKLMDRYDKIFAKLGIKVGQILVNKDDAKYKERRQNIKHTTEALWQSFKAIPIINENDAVNFNEIKIGDNDTLSAIVASITDADLLVLLSDIDGLYTSNPKNDPKAIFLHHVEKLTKAIEQMASPPTSKVGTGGMVTKIKAAKIALGTRLANGKNCKMIIKSGLSLNPLSNKDRFTLFGKI
jgi:glutamate 5-kinase